MRIEQFNSTIFPDWCGNILITSTPDNIRDSHMADMVRMFETYKECLDGILEENISNIEVWIHFKLWALYCKQNFRTPLILFGTKRLRLRPDLTIHLLEIGMLDTITGHREKFNECIVENGTLMSRHKLCPVTITVDKLNNE